MFLANIKFNFINSKDCYNILVETIEIFVFEDLYINPKQITENYSCEIYFEQLFGNVAENAYICSA